MTRGCEISFYQAITVVAQQGDLCIDHIGSLSAETSTQTVYDTLAIMVKEYLTLEVITE